MEAVCFSEKSANSDRMTRLDITHNSTTLLCITFLYLICMLLKIVEMCRIAKDGFVNDYLIGMKHN
jgi:hypothetical protein